MLTSSEAAEIYKLKLALQNQIRKRSANEDRPSLWGKTGPVAKIFGVKLRTVKYIWNRQTWVHATKHLWAGEEQGMISPTEVDIRHSIIPAYGTSV